MEATAIKSRVSLADQLIKDGHLLSRSGPNLVCLCPFHEERSPSFTIFDDKFKCFGCGKHGDVIDYIQHYRGIGFKEAKAYLGDYSMMPRDFVPPRPKPAPRAVPATDADLDVMRGMAEALARDPDRCRQIAKGRGWKPETVRGLALEGSLGWYNGKTAFLYRNAAKLRWDAAGKRNIIWHPAGRELTLWRSDFLAIPFPRVYLSEGETDGISLIDGGAEEEGRALVVAMPNCNTFRPQWAPLFTGREVILCLDNDQAGERGTDSTVEKLRPYARCVRVLDWKEIAL